MKYLVLIVALCSCSSQPINEPVADRSELLFSAIQKTKSRAETIKLSVEDFDPNMLQIEGGNSKFFEYNLSNVSDGLVEVFFLPDSGFIGTASARLIYKENQHSVLNVPLKGLSTKALEGENEPALSLVLRHLGYNVDVGWETLSNHLHSDLQGEELKQSWFIKADSDKVEMIPLARYSPSFALEFGIFSQNEELVRFGVLSGSKDFPEHQTIFPSIESGSSSLSINDQLFGFYCISPTHSAFSIDEYNDTDHARHAVRIYPAKNRENEVLENQFLVCFEEAQNGDYQDYVFLLKNVKPYVEN